MTNSKVLTIVVTAAGPAGDVDQLITVATRQGWTCTVMATPNAVAFLNEPVIEQLTGTPVRSEYNTRPSQVPRSPSQSDALIIAPATFNTINKIAAGIADNYPLTTVAEQIGLGVSTVIVPFVNTAFAARRPFLRSVESLRDEGIQVYWGRKHDWEPHPPGSGAVKQQSFPWQQAFELLLG